MGNIFVQDQVVFNDRIENEIAAVSTDDGNINAQLGNFFGSLASPNDQCEVNQNGAECLEILQENIPSSSVNNMVGSNVAAQPDVSCTYLNTFNEFSLAEMDILLIELPLLES